MKTKSASRTEVLVSLSNQEIIFLKEVVNMYIQRDFGDIDDPAINKIKKEMGQELHQIWTQMNPS
jgi:hypothetical protein